MSINALLAATSLRIADFYQTNGNSLSSNLLTAGSGKRVNSAEDDAVDYFRIGRMNSTISGIDRVRQNIAAGSAMLKMAQTAGTSVLDDVADMQSLLNDYYDPETSSEARDSDAIKFNTIAQRISSTIGSTYYDGKKLIADSSANPLLKVSIAADDPSQTCDISYDGTNVVDTSGLTLGQTDKATESAALNAQYERAQSYLARTAAFTSEMGSFYSITNSQKKTLQQTISNEQECNTGEVIAQITKQQVCQQGSLAMLAQANLLQQNLLQLVLKL